MKNIELKSKEYWVKIVGMLEQNWAIIELENEKTTIYFIHDGSVIFDIIEYEKLYEAEYALKKNGFKLYLDNKENFTEFIFPPKMPFEYISRPIYSSGQFWK
jgi:hypothetical protein